MKVSLSIFLLAPSPPTRNSRGRGVGWKQPAELTVLSLRAAAQYFYYFSAVQCRNRIFLIARFFCSLTPIPAPGQMDQDSGGAVLAPFRDQLVLIYCMVFKHFSTKIDFSWINFFLFQVMTVFIVSEHIQALFIFTECEIKNCCLFVHPQHGFPENENIGMLKEQFSDSRSSENYSVFYRYVC